MRELTQQSRSREDRDCNGGGAVRADTAVFQDGEDSSCVVPASQGVAGVGQAILVKRAGEQHRDADDERRRGQCAEGQKTRVERAESRAE